MITFIESGNRIATENFETGEIYTITYTNGNYRTMCCIGIGTDFVMFQGTSPNALFCLTLGTSETVSTIELGGGGSGTMNYNELENKPQINGIVLIGNKTASDLNLVSQAELADYATNASVVSALASKQDTLTTTQLTAVNSGITSSLVTQIITNQNNIINLIDYGAKNVLDMYTFERGSMYADVDSSKPYRVRVHGTGQGVDITYGQLKSFDSGAYVAKINIVSGTITSLYLNDGNDNISISTATTGQPITLDSTKTYLLRTYAGNGANVDFTVDIMLCKKSEYDTSDTIVPYCPTVYELYELIKSYHSTP